MNELRGLVSLLVCALLCGCVKKDSPAPAAPPAAKKGAAVRQKEKPPARVKSSWDGDKWALWSGGTKLRGANIWQARSYKGVLRHHVGMRVVGPKVTQKDLDELAAWGANYVHISHAGIFSEKPPFEVDPVVQENLDRLLAKIAKARMFATIGFRTGPGRSEFTFSRDEVGDWFKKKDLDESVWKRKGKQAAWVKMWRHAAARYKDNPIVVGYDLMVEPNSNEVLARRLKDDSDPKVFYKSRYAGSSYDWNTLYPKMIAGIREVDDKVPILVGGMGYSSIDWLLALKVVSDERVVYTFHQYVPYASYTHQKPGGKNSYPGRFDLDWDKAPDRFDKKWLVRLIAKARRFADRGKEGTLPMAVTEFGVMRWQPGGHTFLADTFEIFERHGWNHALWMWYPASYPADLTASFNALFGYDSKNFKRVSGSELIDTIKASWKLNTIRP